MNKKQWQSANVKERAEYLLSAELVVKKQTGIDPKSKVGDCKAITVFAVHAGIVQISNWHTKSQDALVEAAETLNDWEKELNK